jgi:AP-2 complex subunit alpha
VQFALAGG